MTVLSRPVRESELALTAAGWRGGSVTACRGSRSPIPSSPRLRNTDRSSVEREGRSQRRRGFAVRTGVRNDYITRHEDSAVREREPLGYWIPPEKLDEGQRQDRSPDRVAAEHRAPGVDRDPMTHVPLAADSRHSAARFGTVAPCIAGEPT